jgi:hypothetical protein
MAHNPASSSSSEASGAAGHDLNPFHAAAAPPLPIAASSIPLLNIKHHVPEILDLHDSNYASWSSLFELTFRKLGLVDHVDGSVNAQARLLDVEWTQIDHCIVSWIYLTVSKTIRDMVFNRRATAFSAWNAVRDLFLNNASRRAMYALQDFHCLQQGDISVHDYCCRLKRLTDTLTDVGHPVTNQDLVVNTLCGINSKFSNALGVITAMHPLSSFLWVHAYLLQEETRVDHSHKMDVANTLLAAVGSSAGAPAGSSAGSAAATLVATDSSAGSKPPPPPTASSPTKGSEGRKKRKQSDGRRNNSGSTPPNQTPSDKLGGHLTPGLAWFRHGRFPRPTGVLHPAARFLGLALLLRPCSRRHPQRSCTPSAHRQTSTLCFTANHPPPPATRAVGIGSSTLAPPRI